MITETQAGKYTVPGLEIYNIKMVSWTLRFNIFVFYATRCIIILVYKHKKYQETFLEITVAKVTIQVLYTILANIELFWDSWIV